MENEDFTFRRINDRITRVPIERNVLQSEDRVLRAHKLMPDGAPAYYIIEQEQVINPEDTRGKAWRCIIELCDKASARRYITAHNRGDAAYQRAAIRKYERFDCPIELDEYSYTATI